MLWGVRAKSLGSVKRLRWPLCGTRLLSLGTRWGMGKQLVQKAPGGLLPIFCELICLSFCVFKFVSILMKSKADLKDSWMVEYAC